MTPVSHVDQPTPGQVAPSTTFRRRPHSSSIKGKIVEEHNTGDDTELETSLLPPLAVDIENDDTSNNNNNYNNFHSKEEFSPDSNSVDTFTWTCRHLSLLRGGDFATGQRLQDLVISHYYTI